MLLPYEEAQLFFELHSALLYYANQRLKVLPGIQRYEDIRETPAAQLAELRDALNYNPELLQEFVDQNREELSDEEAAIVLGWSQAVSGTFYLFRQLKNYMIFLSEDKPMIAYGVVALSQPIETMVPLSLPVMINAYLLPYKGQIIYDGFFSSHSISFGGGIKRMLNDSYRSAKKQPGVVTSLPFDPSAATKAVTTSTSKKVAGKKAKKSSPANNAKLQAALEAISLLIEQFCHLHLNDEYATACQEMAHKLSRKRPSPLTRGKVATWACGILRTVGGVNFLSDPATKPCLSPTVIDQAMGVARSTGQAKTREIRKLLKIEDFGLEWTLPSQIANNPLAWMLEVNGFIMDMRKAPREIQEQAFERGLIPYIPADSADSK